MHNISNTVTLIGRLTDDPKVFVNDDGSNKVRFTLAVKDNYKNAQGEVGTQYIPVETFISKESVKTNGIGRYANIHEGDQIGVEGQVRQNNYTDKDGQKVYGIIVRVETLTMLEPKSITDARQAKKAADAAAAQAAPAETPAE